VLDEPTRTLDPGSYEAFVHALRKLAQTRLVVLITHELWLAELADRIIWFEGGSIRCEGPPHIPRQRADYRAFWQHHAVSESFASTDVPAHRG
jgi:ATP-binding cassette subfamily B protein